MRILIIDDSKSVHAYLRQIFAGKDIDLEDAFNGDEGISLIRSRPAYDLVLLDWEMPVKTGPETLTQLKADKYPVPIIMMTSKNAQEDIEQMMAAGAAEYIMKPFTVDILFDRISTVCGIEVK